MLTSSISICWKTTLFYGKKIFLGPWDPHSIQFKFIIVIRKNIKIITQLCIVVLVLSSKIYIYQIYPLTFKKILMKDFHLF
jgi:hypothetical protein